jgi:hypothetical protein
MSCKYTECYHWGSCERSKEKPLSSDAVLSDRCRDYQQAINQIEDYFEYRYLSSDSKEIKKTVMDIIDNLVIQIAKSGNVR